MKEFKKILIEKAKEIEIEITEEKAEKFEEYKNLIIEWNEKVNLTAITDEMEIITKHFLDSISIIKYIDIKEGIKAIDIGTGAGFPGIPLKIMYPELEIMLLDSLNKRVKFLNIAIESLELTNIEAIHMRAEDGANNKDFREKYDLCFSRAVANLAVLTEYCLPYVKVSGKFISYKGPEVSEEVIEATTAINKLGGKLEFVEKVHFPESDIIHSLLIIGKVKQTPSKYPRKPSVIKQMPIK